MPADSPLLFQLMSARADFLQARHAVLAQNVANADTPGYRPKDLVEPDFAKLLGRQSPQLHRVALERTRSDHLAGARRLTGAARYQRLDAAEVAPAGNAVVIEEQLRLMGGAARGYQLATSVYGKYVGLLRTAIGSGG